MTQRNKLTLITGGSGSGKSAFAEEMLNYYQGEKVYIATMQVYGEEGHRKVLRHRKLREGKGFSTIECQRNIEAVASEVCGKAVLLECIMNLVANEMFSDEMFSDEMYCNETLSDEMHSDEMHSVGASYSEILSTKTDDIVSRITKGIAAIAGTADEVVIVTGIVSEDGIDYGEDTTAYIEALSKVNAFVANMADNVYEVVCGIGRKLKGRESTKEETKAELNSNGNGENMILYIGGFGEGKYSYVSSKHKEGTIINKLNEKVRDWLRSGQDPYEMIEELLTPEVKCVICDEIGNGIVPNDSFDREYRETVGRIVTEVAKKADAVYRIVCGVEQRIK